MHENKKKIKKKNSRVQSPESSHHWTPSTHKKKIYLNAYFLSKNSLKKLKKHKKNKTAFTGDIKKK